MNLFAFFNKSKETELGYAISEFIKSMRRTRTSHLNFIKDNNVIFQIVDQLIYVSSIQGLDLNNDLFIILTFNKDKKNSDGYLTNFKKSRFYQLAQFVELGGESYFIGVKSENNIIESLITEILRDVFENTNEYGLTYQLMR